MLLFYVKKITITAADDADNIAVARAVKTFSCLLRKERSWEFNFAPSDFAPSDFSLI